MALSLGQPDLTVAVSSALGNLKAVVDEAITLTHRIPPPSLDEKVNNVNTIATAATNLGNAVAALKAAGVDTDVNSPQNVALNAAIQSGLQLWQTTLTNLRQAGVSGI
jgi:hypothetical protein